MDLLVLCNLDHLPSPSKRNLVKAHPVLKVELNSPLNTRLELQNRVNDTFIHETFYVLLFLFIDKSKIVYKIMPTCYSYFHNNNKNNNNKI